MHCTPPLNEQPSASAVRVSAYPTMTSESTKATTATASASEPLIGSGSEISLSEQPQHDQQELLEQEQQQHELRLDSRPHNSDQQRQQTQPLLQPLQAISNSNGRVSFHDKRMEVRIASLACLSDELRNDIWYSPSDIEGMRSEARDLCRFLRVNPEACPEEHTRGLELRISLERQCRKQMMVQGVVEAQRSCDDPCSLASLAQRCSIVPRDLALAQGQRDYSTAYSVPAVAQAFVASSASAKLRPDISNYDDRKMTSTGVSLRTNSHSTGRLTSNQGDLMMGSNDNNQFNFSCRGSDQLSCDSFPFQSYELPQSHCNQSQQKSLHCFNEQQQQEAEQHQKCPQQQDHFYDVSLSNDEIDVYDPIMMEPIPFSPMEALQEYQLQQDQQEQVCPHQLQLEPLVAFFDDSKGKRSLDNMRPTASSISLEDPQDRTVRRRLEEMSHNTGD